MLIIPMVHFGFVSVISKLPGAKRFSSGCSIRQMPWIFVVIPCLISLRKNMLISGFLLLVYAAATVSKMIGNWKLGRKRLRSIFCLMKTHLIMSSLRRLSSAKKKGLTKLKTSGTQVFVCAAKSVIWVSNSRIQIGLTRRVRSDGVIRVSTN